VSTVRATLATARIQDLLKDFGFDWDEVSKIIDEVLMDAMDAERKRSAEIVENESKNGHWSSQHLLRKALAKEIRGT